MPALEWRKDAYGTPDVALYFGNIYVGEIHRLTNPDRRQAPWRAWLMTTDEGGAIGHYATPDQARMAVESKFKELTT